MFWKLRTKYENSSYYKNKLIKKHKKSLTPGIKTTDELIRILKNNYSAREIPQENIDTVFWKYSVLYNLESSQSHNGTYNFKVFKIIRDDKSEPMYKLWEKINETDESDYIFVIFETNTGFITGNCNTLFQFLMIERGIGNYDYDNNTSVMIDYLMNLHDYKKMKI